jgi:hypothetical protein
MCRCELCGPQSHHEAEFSVSLGSEDREIKVCRWCSQDLRVLGARVNQIVRLHQSMVHAAFWFLGPVRSLFVSEVKA